jgi:hypothetical protein
MIRVVAYGLLWSTLRTRRPARTRRLRAALGRLYRVPPVYPVKTRALLMVQTAVRTAVRTAGRRGGRS